MADKSLKKIEELSDTLLAQQLQESEDRFKNLADTAPMYIAMADATGNAVYFNQPWLEFTGKKLEQMRGMGWLSTLHPEDAPRFEKDFKYAFRNQIQINKEYRFKRADGEYRWMLAVGSPRFTPNGDFIGYYGTYTDFHDLKQAQLLIEKSEERFRVMADNIPNLAWMARADGYIYWYNSRWYEYTGTTPEQMEGWGWQSVHDPKYLSKVLKKWKAAIKSGSTFEMVFPLKGADHKFRPFLTRVVPLRSADGTIEQWVGSNTDLSEQLRIKAAEERTRELTELNDAKDEFISLASHQLRTPATGVKLYIGMLLDGYAGRLTAKQREYINRAHESNEREIDIINDLLKVAQVDAGKIILNKKRINLVKFINDILDEQAGKFAERDQKIIFEHTEKVLMVRADGARIRMALGNLVDNASKYSPLHKNIKVVLKKLGNDRLSFEIIDEGVGIRAKDANRIFDKFVRADNHLSDASGGSGLGLYLVKKIVDLHDGSISVSSKPGKGSRFTIILPV